jgi:hypothetical protein
MRPRVALTFVVLLATLTIACSSPTAPEHAGLEPGEGTLVIDAFEMLELNNPDAGVWSWTYAPRVHVSSTRDEWITVTMISASLGPASLMFSPPGCPTAKRVAPNSSRDLFGYDGYGDFETSYVKPGVRVPPGTTAHVVVTFTGKNGTGQAAADTVVMPGTFPPSGVSTISEPCGWPGQSGR